MHNLKFAMEAEIMMRLRVASYWFQIVCMMVHKLLVMLLQICTVCH